MGITKAAKRIRDAMGPVVLAPVDLEGELGQRIDKSLIGGERLEVRPWTPEVAEADFYAQGRKCTLCGRRYKVRTNVLYTLSRSLLPRKHAAWGLELPSFVICKGCWAFLCAITSWEELEHRIRALQEIIVAGLRGKPRKSRRRFHKTPSFLRMSGIDDKCDTLQHAAERAQAPTRHQTQAQYPVWAESEDGDSCEDEL